MKQVWIGVVFFLVYGLFSIKTQAAESGFTAHTGLHQSGCRGSASCLGK
jgi:hypothetical protein